MQIVILRKECNDKFMQGDVSNDSNDSVQTKIAQMSIIDYKSASQNYI